MKGNRPSHIILDDIADDKPVDKERLRKWFEEAVPINIAPHHQAIWSCLVRKRRK